MTRRTQGLQNEQNNEEDQDARLPGTKHPRSEPSDEDEEEVRPKARKRTKKSQSEQPGPSNSVSKRKNKMPEQFKKVRGKFGLLQRLAKDVPLDVIFEVFMHLNPSDLLSLARTSKTLRNMLMSKSSASIWRATRANMPTLPPLPDDLSEPQYAHLLFSEYCHICLNKRRTLSTLWSLRVRACLMSNECPMNMSIQFELVASLDVDSRVKDVLLPFMYFKGGVFRSGPVSYHASSAARKYKAEFDAIQDADEQESWLARMKEVRQQALEHQILRSNWMRSIDEARTAAHTAAVNVIREQRKQDILRRLEEVGWREEADLMVNSRSDPFSKHKLVKQGRKLTDHNWNTIKTELVEFLSEQKKKRLTSNTMKFRFNLDNVPEQIWYD
ncbi:hypothetical protein BT96DRAFT_969103 [Gymnopus androsaceus JB14]|uniref:F-box domain-containing protein n=1 Tax=Gymnopus androsaceus JB14 TaxID=1447944 RepID=A0A6A4IJZ4_9AGAR|nr:hypothetical protein BT96DRAFT_969103 [Gymnopus androsaceus JB14]